MALLFIEVKNWTDFQEREDRSNYIWFKFANDFFSDRKLRLVPLLTRLTFAYILCERSKSKKPFAELNLEIASFELERSPDDLMNDITLLESIAVISRVDAGSFQENPGAYRLDKRRKEKNRKEKKREDKNPAASADQSFDFKSIAKEFPNAKGRSEGIKRLASLIKTPETFEAFCKAVRNYAKQCELDRTEAKFIKHFSSFVGSDRRGHPWEDWVDHTPATGATSAQGRVTDQNKNALGSYAAKLGVTS